ncbi:MAG: PAS domain S-box protein, partial [Betaproteobacteria bacterium]|nr:PAS domain S-box protein [Betaproteobacteria bacterium]
MRAQSGDPGAGTRYQSSFDRVAVGIVHTTTDGRILEVNRRLCEMLGYSAAELLGMTTRDLTHPDDRDRQDQMRRELLAGGRSHFSGDKRYLRKDGSAFWVSRTVALARETPDGEAYLIQTIEGINERKRAQDDLRESEMRLRAANEQLEMLVQSSPLAIYTRDADGLLTSWNPAAEKMFGWSASEVLGKPLPSVPDAERPDSDGLRMRLLAGETFAKVEARRRRRDGSPIDVDAFVGPLRDGSGNVNGIIAVVTDITERKRGEEALRTSEERFRATFDSAPIGIMHTDIDTYRILHVNPKLCEMLGYTRDELLTMASTDIVHPDYR